MKLLSFKAMSSNSAHKITGVRTGLKISYHRDAYHEQAVTAPSSEVGGRGSYKRTTVGIRYVRWSWQILLTGRLSQTQLESSKQTPGTSSSCEGKDKDFQPKRRNFKSVHVVQEIRKKTSSCPICRNEYAAHKCEVFLSKSPTERKRLVISRHICFNCLSSHLITNCKSSRQCRICIGKHHTLLHFNNSSKQNSSQNTTPSDSSKESVKEIEFVSRSQRRCVLGHGLGFCSLWWRQRTSRSRNPYRSRSSVILHFGGALSEPKA